MCVHTSRAGCRVCATVPPHEETGNHARRARRPALARETNEDGESIAPVELIRDRIASHVVRVEQCLVLRRAPVVDRDCASEGAAVIHLCAAKPDASGHPAPCLSCGGNALRSDLQLHDLPASRPGVDQHRTVPLQTHVWVTNVAPAPPDELEQQLPRSVPAACPRAIAPAQHW